ncbi:MAG TPA: DUF5675 family protein [Candidatus Acidoferrales bacterium]|nr:DUF5675 family protein [Candidatus Acidoferrales bacterium]
MRLTLTRQQGTALSTPGMLDIDGVFQCYTLEPRMDRSHGKPYAIPAGNYTVVLERSPHFSIIMGYLFITPHVLDVPGFDYVEIHPGNKPADTLGCTLVGETRSPAAPDWIGNSVLAFTTLLSRLKACKVPLTISYVDFKPEKERLK